jgi:hypothetical protein
VQLIAQAKKLSREEFKREVKRQLTRKRRRRGELSTSKPCKRRLTVIEKGIETAGSMLDKSRGY